MCGVHLTYSRDPLVMWTVWDHRGACVKVQYSGTVQCVCSRMSRYLCGLVYQLLPRKVKCTILLYTYTCVHYTYTVTSVFLYNTMTSYSPLSIFMCTGVCTCVASVGEHGPLPPHAHLHRPNKGRGPGPSTVLGVGVFLGVRIGLRYSPRKGVGVACISGCGG